MQGKDYVLVMFFLWYVAIAKAQLSKTDSHVIKKT